MKLFEYMAAGAPIVASDLPALREVLRHGENAWFVAPGDVEALAEGIATLLCDPPLAARLAAQARQDVEAYTWETRARWIFQAVGLPVCATGWEAEIA
jgi:glycosyltransferase involved in cell wall biosynthesis